MKETFYLTGTSADRSEIVDFANYVFSQAHQPHDFKKLLPKTYADDAPPMEHWHYLAKQEGRIRAMVACRPVDMHYGEDTLQCGFIGTVSVHPYARGEGHMKKLMHMVIDDARQQGKDMLILGGQRQRYNYFGFEQAGISLNYNVTPTNIRHLLGDLDKKRVQFIQVTEDMTDEIAYCHRLSHQQPLHGVRPMEEYLPIMRSWNSTLYLVQVDGSQAGYIMTAGEWVLEDENLLPLVIKAYVAFTGVDRISLACAPHQKTRIALLSKLCGGRSIASVEMVHVLNYPKVVETLLRFKASYAVLQDGCVTLKVEDLPAFTIRVENGVPTVREENLPAELTLSHMEAQRLLFDLESAVCESPLPASWVPLPFFMSPADTF